MYKDMNKCSDIGMVGGGLQAASQSVPPVGRAIDSLDITVDRLREDISMLLDRLTPVSMPMLTGATGDGTRQQASCVVEERVLDVTMRLQNLAAAVRNAREALCI